LSIAAHGRKLAQKNSVEEFFDDIDAPNFEIKTGNEIFFPLQGELRTDVTASFQKSF